MTHRNTDYERTPARIARWAPMDAFERQLLEEAIDIARGDRARAARSIGLSLNAFELKAERLGIGSRRRRRRRGASGEPSRPAPRAQIAAPGSLGAMGQRFGLGGGFLAAGCGALPRGSRRSRRCFCSSMALASSASSSPSVGSLRRSLSGMRGQYHHRGSGDCLTGNRTLP